MQLENNPNHSSEIFQVGACTDIGTRYSVNQDSYKIDNDKGFFLVADGMGGGPAGEVASRIAINTTYNHILSTAAGGISNNHEGLLHEAIHKAHAAIKSAITQAPAYRGMGTTIAIAWILPAQRILWTAHVGDSRVYLFRDTSLNQLTNDHTVLNVVRQAGMLPDDPEHWPPRSLLSQSLGASDMVAPEVTRHKLEDGDVVFVCTDGIYDVLDGSEIKNILKQARHPQNICKELIHTALAQGASDNLTALVIRPFISRTN